MRDLREPVNIAEQVNQIADELCGFREATFFEIMEAIKTVKTSDSILRVSQNALSRRRDICEAVEQLMTELDALAENN